MIKVYICVGVLLIVFAIIHRMLFLRPRYRHMFKRNEKESRVSISYAVLFDIYKIAELIQRKLKKEPSLYIRAFGIKRDFDRTQTLEMIEETLISFQEEILKSVPFRAMYYKNTFETLLEIWSDYSRYHNYRNNFFRVLYLMYSRREINLPEFFHLVVSFCDL